MDALTSPPCTQSTAPVVVGEAAPAIARSSVDIERGNEALWAAMARGDKMAEFLPTGGYRKGVALSRSTDAMLMASEHMQSRQ